MIEGSCDFLTEEQVLEAIELGHESIRIICQAIGKWQQEIGKPKKTDTIKALSQEIVQQVDVLIGEKINKALRIKEKTHFSTYIGESDTCL